MWFWLLPLLLFTPWILAIAWLWRRLPDDGWLPPSVGSQVRRQTLSRG